MTFLAWVKEANTQAASPRPGTAQGRESLPFEKMSISGNSADNSRRSANSSEVIADSCANYGRVHNAFLRFYIL